MSCAISRHPFFLHERENRPAFNGAMRGSNFITTRVCILPFSSGDSSSVYASHRTPACRDRPQHRFDHVRRKPLVGELIAIRQILARATPLGFAIGTSCAFEIGLRLGIELAFHVTTQIEIASDGQFLRVRQIHLAAGRGTHIQYPQCRSNNGSVRRRDAHAVATAHWTSRDRCTTSSVNRASIRTTCATNSDGRRTRFPSAQIRPKRDVKFFGVISLRKLLPDCAMPNGTRTRVLSQTFLKFTKMP